jgi:hypothetical protein
MVAACVWPDICDDRNFVHKIRQQLDRNKNGKGIGLIFAIKPEFLGWIFVIFASFGKIGSEIKSIA